LAFYFHIQNNLLKFRRMQMNYLKSWQNRKFFINENDRTYFKVTNVISRRHKTEKK